MFQISARIGEPGLVGLAVARIINREAWIDYHVALETRTCMLVMRRFKTVQDLLAEAYDMAVRKRAKTQPADGA